jgi:hypothetical protein
MTRTVLGISTFGFARRLTAACCLAYYGEILASSGDKLCEFGAGAVGDYNRYLGTRATRRMRIESLLQNDETED